MLINISLAPQELQSVQEAMESYIDGLTTAYQIDLRNKLLMALSAQASIENSVHDSEPNDGCDSNPCPYCIEHSNAQTRSGYAAAVDVHYVLNRLNHIKGDGEFDADEFFQFIDELEKVVGVSND